MRLGSKIAVLAAILGFMPSLVEATEIKVLSGNGGRVAVAELSGRFETATAHKVNIDFAVNPQVRKRVLDGEAFDVAVLNPPVLDELIKAGKVKADTRFQESAAGGQKGRLSRRRRERHLFRQPGEAPRH